MKSLFPLKMMLFIIALAGFLFTSCEKEDSAKADKTSLLVEKNWKRIALTIDPPKELGSGDKISNLYAQLEPCERDNLFIFHKDGTATSDEGPSKCSSSDPQTQDTGLWAINENQTVITLNDNGYVQELKILELTNSRFKGEVLEKEDDGTIYTYTITFEKQ